MADRSCDQRLQLQERLPGVFARPLELAPGVSGIADADEATCHRERQPLPGEQLLERHHPYTHDEMLHPVEAARSTHAGCTGSSPVTSHNVARSSNGANPSVANAAGKLVRSTMMQSVAATPVALGTPSQCFSWANPARSRESA